MRAAKGPPSLALVLPTGLLLSLWPRPTVVRAQFAKGASAGRDWDCGWELDESAVHLTNMGLADATPRSGAPKVGPQQSARACERWCCAAKHLRFGPEVVGGPSSRKARQTRVLH